MSQSDLQSLPSSAWQWIFVDQSGCGLLLQVPAQESFPWALDLSKTGFPREQPGLSINTTSAYAELSYLQHISLNIECFLSFPSGTAKAASWLSRWMLCLEALQVKTNFVTVWYSTGKKNGRQQIPLPECSAFETWCSCFWKAWETQTCVVLPILME